MSDASKPNEGEGSGLDEGDLPKLDFSTFVLSIIHSAYVHLGDAPSPGEAEGQNLLLARQDIDLLSLLEEKTRGNLNGEEERLLSQALYDLRVRYVEVAKGS
ncbi:DUF1844 domain-containing protein [Chondromyces crocatus]|uniref:DUF1844 domain-containing protein n=1 Tax=Chondromyces crocatus TaxID=52 RepID=A0A0K1ER93_CHOCO|nr:DUF1844 domain-containing protein [Chondromyces crocatus]AKT43366.1 uncharacterized protein CMC5_075980 [Chondromyces crocatus]